MKKLLALVLALVMTVGLATVGASAAYSDAADVSLNEAVDVMSAVGVFQGSDGKFAPKENLTREQAAKLIAYLDLGENTAEALPALKVFDDVETTRWSAKYIAYCQDAGYIAGVGGNKFNPTGELTGYAFGKMVLCALGYDATIEGFTGNNWSLNVAKLMEKNGIADGIDGAASLTLTREQAAQYCFNALQADCVEYENKGTTVTAGGATITTGASKATAVANRSGVTYNSDTAGLATTATGATLQLCEKLYGNNLKLSAATDDFGRAADKWTYKTKTASITVSDDPIVTYTKKMTSSSNKKVILADLQGYKFGTNNDELKSVDTTSTATYTKGDLPFTSGNKIIDDIAAATGNGKLVEIYGKDGVITNVVVATYRVAKVTSVTKNSDGDVTYIIGGVSMKDYKDDVANDDTIVFETAPAKDDIVTYTLQNGVYYVYATTKVEGAQSASNTDTLTIGGTAYTIGTGVAVSQNFTSTMVTLGNGGQSPADAFANSTTAAVYYLDQYGFVVNHGEIETETNYAIVDEIAGVAATGVSSAKKVEAKLIFADGTTKTVNVSKINGLKVSNSGFTTTTGTAGTLDTDSASFTTATNTSTKVQVDTNKGNNAALDGVWVSYKETDDGYELTYNAGQVSGYTNTAAPATNNYHAVMNVINPTYVGSATSFKFLTKGVASSFNAWETGVTNTGNAGGAYFTASSSTVYVIKTLNTSGDPVYTSYTGYANVPDVKVSVPGTAGTYTATAYYIQKDGKITNVYIDATAAGNSAGTTKTQILYFTGGTVNSTRVGTGSSAYWTSKGFLNGEPLTTDNHFDVNPATSTSTKVFYAATLDDDGDINAIDTVGAPYGFTASGTVSKAQYDAKDSSTFAGYTVNSSSKIYVIDDSEISEGSLDSIDISDFYGIDVVKADGTATEQVTIKVMYIVKADSGTANSTAISVGELTGTAYALDTGATTSLTTHIGDTATVVTNTTTGTATATVYSASNGETVVFPVTLPAGATATFSQTTATAAYSAPNVTLTNNGGTWGAGTLTVTSADGTATQAYNFSVVDGRVSVYLNGVEKKVAPNATIAAFATQESVSKGYIGYSATATDAGTLAVAGTALYAYDNNTAKVAAGTYYYSGIYSVTVTARTADKGNVRFALAAGTAYTTGNYTANVTATALGATTAETDAAGINASVGTVGAASVTLGTLDTASLTAGSTTGYVTTAVGTGGGNVADNAGSFSVTVTGINNNTTITLKIAGDA